MPPVSELYARLSPDEWRRRQPFSDDVQRTNVELHDASQSDAKRAAALNAWLTRHQPCLFGRIAAKRDLIQYCILTEEDLIGPEDRLRDKIQRARSDWWAAGFKTRASGVGVAAVS